MRHYKRKVKWRRWEEKDRKEMIRLIMSGYSISQVAKKIGRTKTAVTSELFTHETGKRDICSYAVDGNSVDDVYAKIYGSNVVDGNFNKVSDIDDTSTRLLAIAAELESIAGTLRDNVQRDKRKEDVLDALTRLLA